MNFLSNLWSKPWVKHFVYGLLAALAAFAACFLASQNFGTFQAAVTFIAGYLLHLIDAWITSQDSSAPIPPTPPGITPV